MGDLRDSDKIMRGVGGGGGGEEEGVTPTFYTHIDAEGKKETCVGSRSSANYRKCTSGSEHIGNQPCADNGSEPHKKSTTK